MNGVDAADLTNLTLHDVKPFWLMNSLSFTDGRFVDKKYSRVEPRILYVSTVCLWHDPVFTMCIGHRYNE